MAEIRKGGLYLVIKGRFAGASCIADRPYPCGQRFTTRAGADQVWVSGPGNWIVVFSDGRNILMREAYLQSLRDPGEPQSETNESGVTA